MSEARSALSKGLGVWPAWAPPDAGGLRHRSLVRELHRAEACEWKLPGIRDHQSIVTYFTYFNVLKTFLC